MMGVQKGGHCPCCVVLFICRARVGHGDDDDDDGDVDDSDEENHTDDKVDVDVVCDGDTDDDDDDDGDTDDDEVPEETLRILDDEVLDLLQEEEVDDEVLLLLRDVCCGHADNTRRLCFNENALVTILGIAFRVSTNRSQVRAAIAAEVLSFCSDSRPLESFWARLSFFVRGPSLTFTYYVKARRRLLSTRSFSKR